MKMTERQAEILNGVVREYIRLAQPISSQWLEKKCRPTISSATIRNDLHKLTEESYLCQPYTSAGRVPTDKGYRFFVDRLLEREMTELKLRCKRELKDITKFLAEESSNLALGYWPEKEIVWKEGWSRIFREPEFFEAGLAAEFGRILNELEENVELVISPDIRVYIGREAPFSRAKDFSIITTSVFAILGPKRMDYNKNINLLKSATKWLKKN